jgi:nicotinate-nucleotide adenylyltransferase
VRLGLFGGTFDPPHHGHLLAASDAVDALGLDRVLFIPNAVQPLKAATGPVASPAQRLAMTRLLVGADPRFVVDPIEVDRGGLSYMIETVCAIAAREPGAALFLLLGADAAATLPQWREPDRLASLAEVVVLTRAGSADPPPSRLRRVATRRVDISSTEIRSRVAAGLPLTGFVPDAVAAYVRDQAVYGQGPV